MEKIHIASQCSNFMQKMNQSEKGKYLQFLSRPFHNPEIVYYKDSRLEVRVWLTAVGDRLGPGAGVGCGIMP